MFYCYYLIDQIAQMFLINSYEQITFFLMFGSDNFSFQFPYR
jgi:hypothetical protein